MKRLLKISEKLVIDINIFATLMIVLVVGMMIVFNYNSTSKNDIETEYYKEQLKSYPYNHSEIKDTVVKNKGKKLN